MRCFAKSGFDATSMADIIAESGVSAGAIYSYFKNKQELIVHVTRDVLKSRAAELDELEQQDPLPPPAAVVRMFLIDLAQDIGDLRIFVQIWAAAAAEPHSMDSVAGVVVELRALYERYLRAWFVHKGFSEEEADGRALAIAPIIVAMCQGYILQSVLVPDFDSDGYLAALDLVHM
ncbi:TetR/AcrR family transcriptional regulator [Rhodococcus sp. G-MC3]|uniref:TetR/AcrR family transcriptional regulator n=1 Tax=Rhodococcus sp. G-MC3 TaxID=3046209 RepID=UPI0024B895D1|nr:TetR/AcrR family transcriptional regulator [Rhodococcus sp. G-MC3]MDJ0393872.1 TetR/AcrR family transcriptional regulator [Rhodococcus sp. G-MC3]